MENNVDRLNSFGHYSIENSRIGQLSFCPFHVLKNKCLVGRFLKMLVMGTDAGLGVVSTRSVPTLHRCPTHMWSCQYGQVITNVPVQIIVQFGTDHSKLEMIMQIINNHLFLYRCILLGFYFEITL